MLGSAPRIILCSEKLVFVLLVISALLVSTLQSESSLVSEDTIVPSPDETLRHDNAAVDFDANPEMGQPVDTLYESGDPVDSIVAVTSPDMAQDTEKAMSSNATGSDEANSTSNATANATDTRVNCLQRTLEVDEVPQVALVNSSALLKVLTPVPNVTSGECAVVMFYSTWCIFSARAAPHFNALARVFPQIHCLALNAASYSGLNMRYGLVALPTMLLFHNGRAIAKFNDTEPKLQKLVTFVTKFTGLVPNVTVNVTSADFYGPVPAKPQPHTDYALILAWLFTLACLCMWFLKSSLWQRIVESVRNNWREAEAQHEHED